MEIYASLFLFLQHLQFIEVIEYRSPKEQSTWKTHSLINNFVLEDECFLF